MNLPLPWGPYLGLYLGWGWSPVVLVIALGLSIGLARRSGRSFLMVLPALVLFFGVDWRMVWWLDVPFIAAFWVLVILAVATGISPRATRFAHDPLKLMLGLIATLFAVFLVLLLWVVWSGPQEGVFVPQAEWWKLTLWAIPLAALVGASLLLTRRLWPFAVVFLVAGVWLALDFNTSLPDPDVTPYVAPSGPNPVFDVCPYIDGERDPAVQDEVPAGYVIDDSGLDTAGQCVTE